MPTHLDTAANMCQLGTGINFGIADMILPAHAQDISLGPLVESLQVRKVEFYISPRLRGIQQDRQHQNIK